MPERLPELTLEAKRAGLIQFMEVAKKASFNTQKVLIDGRKMFDDPEVKNLLNKCQASFKFAAQDLQLLLDYLNRPKYEKA